MIAQRDDNPYPIDETGPLTVGSIPDAVDRLVAATIPAEGRGHCEIPWCESLHDYRASSFEHFTLPDYVPVTGESLRLIGFDLNRRPDEESLLTAAVVLRHNEDIEPAPKVVIHVLGGPEKLDVEVSFQLDEAVLFHRRLANALETVTRGTNLDGAAIERFYGIVRNQDVAEVPPAVDTSRVW